MAGEAHPVPCRTRKLSPRAPMVLRSESVGEQVAADQRGTFAGAAGHCPGAPAFLYSCLERPANSWVLNKLRQLGTLRGFVWVDVSANRVATVYTNAPKRRRGAVLADLLARSSRRNSVHKCPKTTPRGRFRQFVYTPASPRLSTTVQQCTQMPRNGAERPFPPICVHSCLTVPAVRPAPSGR